MAEWANWRVSASADDPDVLALLDALARRGEVEPLAHTPAGRTLVLGGVRSGKSSWAEGRLKGYADVEYVATARPYSDDAEWTARIAAHRLRRPTTWTTVETDDLCGVLAAERQAPVLVDCLGTWLTRVLDDAGVWDERPGALAQVADTVDALVQAWTRSSRHVVAVSNEVGSGVVPGTASGRLFRDHLGRLNALLAAASDEVWLCTAGIARRLA